jgi:hypothetical protein
MKTQGKEAVRKQYVKPQVKKHKSMAVVSGSSCSYYVTSGYSYVYYH